MQHKKLPYAITSYSELINGNYIYVDKTDLVAQLADAKGPYFLARPRRFGKTLLLSTFEELFKTED